MALTANLPDLLTPVETADLLRTTPATLSVWRCTRRIPLPWIKRGRSVLYRREDVLRYLDDQTVRPGEAD